MNGQLGFALARFTVLVLAHTEATEPIPTTRPRKKRLDHRPKALAPEQAPRPGLVPGTYRSSRSHSTGDRPIDRLRGLSQDEEERAESRSCSGRSVSCLPSPLAAVLARPDPRPTTRIDATAMAMNRSEGLAELDGAADGAVAVEVPAVGTCIALI